MNSAFVLLECVEPASKNAFVKRSIAGFCKASGFKAVEVILDLQDVWCAKRKRWWCLLCPKHVPIDSVAPWPTLPDCKVVGEVIHHFIAADDEALALNLGDDELLEFQSRKPIKGYLLDTSKPLPTALHSWGSQTQACPCECRRFPFNKQRLDQGGICAVVIQVEPDPTTGAPNFRHLSAREVATCNGLSPNVFMGRDPKLALALVGQLASPFQSAWVMCHFATALQLMTPLGLCKEEPLQVLKCQRSELLVQAEAAGLRRSALGCSHSLETFEEARQYQRGSNTNDEPNISFMQIEEVASTATDTSVDQRTLEGPEANWWHTWRVPRRGFLSQLIQEAGLDQGSVVQVCDAKGELLPPDALLLQDEVLQVWVAGLPEHGVGASTQATLLPPNVGSFTRPSVLRHARVKSLELQGIWLTDDQMRFGLDSIASISEKMIQVFDPVVMHRGLSAQNPQEFRALTCRMSQGDEAVTAFVCQGHWITMHWKVEVGQSWTSAPLCAGVAEVAVADWLISHVAGCKNMVYQSGPDRPLCPGLCGHFALADLCSRVQGVDPLPVDLALEHSSYISAAFQLCLPDMCRAPLFIGGVQSALLEQSVVQLLREKGATEGDI